MLLIASRGAEEIQLLNKENTRKDSRLVQISLR